MFIGGIFSLVVISGLAFEGKALCSAYNSNYRGMGTQHQQLTSACEFDILVSVVQRAQLKGYIFDSLL